MTIDFHRLNVIRDVIQKVQRHDDLIKTHAVRYATFIRSTCKNLVLLKFDFNSMHNFFIYM